jgi:hypothetical protein
VIPGLIAPGIIRLETHSAAHTPHRVSAAWLFLTDTVYQLAVGYGIPGSWASAPGLSTTENTHGVARRADTESRIVYALSL